MRGKISGTDIFIATRKIGVDEVGSIDPKLVISMAFKGDKIMLVTLNKLMPIREKILLKVPQLIGGIEDPVFIRSLQLKKENGGTFLIVETLGGGTSNLKELSLITGALAGRMDELSLINAFFPATGKMDSRVGIFYGSSMRKGEIKQWNAAPADVTNVRLTQGKAMLFSKGEELFSLPFADMRKKDWVGNAETLHKYDHKISFVGRITNGFVPITLENGDAYFAGVSYSSAKGSGHRQFRREVSRGDKGSLGIVLGVVGDAIAAICPKGEILTFTPQGAGIAV